MSVMVMKRYPLRNKTAGDSGHGSLYRQRPRPSAKGAAADGSLGGRAVGAGDLGHQPEGVGKFLGGGDDGKDGLFSQSPVPYLAASRPSGGLGLARRVRGEIILMHVALALFRVDPVEDLGLADGTEGCYGERLGLAPGEKGGAVDPRDKSHLGGQRADIVQTSAVDPLALVEQPPAR